MCKSCVEFDRERAGILPSGKVVGGPVVSVCEYIPAVLESSTCMSFLVM